MRTKRRTRLLFVAASLALATGAAYGADYTWNVGDSGGNWSVSTNWMPTGVPGSNDTAVLPVPSVVRTVVVDVATTVDTLILDVTDYSDNKNRLRMDADLTVYELKDEGEASTSYNSPARIYVENGSTLTLHETTPSGSGNTCVLYGDGEIVKESSAEIVCGVSRSTEGGHVDDVPFSGTWILNDGTTWSTYSDFENAASMTINNGATLKIMHAYRPQPPQTCYINGSGEGGNGAIWWYGGSQYTTDRDFTLQSDATLNVSASSASVTLGGDVSGTGVLNLKGSGKFVFDQMDYTYSNKIVVANSCTLEVSGKLPNVTNITVESGGTLKGWQSQFPNAYVDTSGGGTWLQTSEAEWQGPGGNNDGGNWSNPTNWWPNIVPTNIAVLPIPSSTRTVIVDVAASIGTLQMEVDNGNDSKNRLMLDANFTVTKLEDKGGETSSYNSPARIYIQNGKTLTFHETPPSGSGNICAFYGNGAVLKDGTAEVNAGVSRGTGTGDTLPFDGTWTLNDGTLYSTFCDLENLASMIVNDGATLKVNTTRAKVPLVLTLNGHGDSDNGALWISGNIQYSTSGDVTIATNATLKFSHSSASLTLTGDLDGTGDLAIIGGGKLDLDNTWYLAVDAAAINSIAVSNGTLDMAGCTLSVSGSESATLNEYVIVDYSSANGTTNGVFNDDNLPDGWSVDHDGTAQNPDCVVLVVGEPSGPVLVPGVDGGGITNDFNIGRRETTVDQYVEFLSGQTGGVVTVTNGEVRLSSTSDLLCLTTGAESRAYVAHDGQDFTAVSGKGQHPMIYVSWFGAAAYCNWASGEESLSAVYDPTNGWSAALGNDGYRLPTEEEWYKAAAWVVTAGVFRLYGTRSDTIATNDANFLNSGDAWETNVVRTTPVATYTEDQSDYFLRDASGNVWEWCHGFYAAGTDPSIAPHAARGGAWGNLSTDVKTTSRCGFKPEQTLNSVGFRILNRE